MNWEVIWVTLIVFAIGMVWYSPLMFLKPWLKGAGIKKSEMKMSPMTMLVGILSNAVYVLVLATVLTYTSASTFFDGVIIGLFLWIGFLAMPMLGGVLWEKKSFQYYFINVLYWLVVTIVAAGLLAIWG